MLDFLNMSNPFSSYYMRTGSGEAVEVWIDREKLPNGSVCCTLLTVDGGEILGCWWESKPKKQRRGGKSRYCIGSRFDELSEKQQLALLKLRGQILNDGRLKSRRKYRQGRKEELAELAGSEGMLTSLLQAGAIYEKDGWFYVDRRFLFRG